MSMAAKAYQLLRAVLMTAATQVDRKKAKKSARWTCLDR
ncbi:hypothetical protein M2302_003550 [Micromonospora sp. A200]|nr:hypothetical protein [Micromonospora sp. A200]